MKIEKAKNLKRETKKRVARMKKEFAVPPDLKAFENIENYSQIIAQVNIPVSALCEHHEVAFHGLVSIAYVPDRTLVGLSKLARVAEFAFNPTVKTLQERGTQQIIDYLHKNLAPKGLMVIVRARHDCITYRGVKKPSVTITSAVRGTFSYDLGARSEFLSLVNANGQD